MYGSKLRFHAKALRKKRQKAQRREDNAFAPSEFPFLAPLRETSNRQLNHRSHLPWLWEILFFLGDAAVDCLPATDLPPHEAAELRNYHRYLHANGEISPGQFV